MARIKHSSELQVGKIVYHVYGCDRTNTTLNPDNITKLIILGKPKMHLLGTCGGKFEGWESPFIDVKVIYTSGYGGGEYDSEYSLHDMGVMDLGRDSKVYNLNRIFSSKEDAEAFLIELQNDSFSDADDAEYAKAKPAAQALADREEFRASMMEYDYGYEDDFGDDFDFGDDE